METCETRRETSREKSVKPSSREHTSMEKKQWDKLTSGDIRPCVSRVGGDKWETSATRRETSREASGHRCKNIRPSLSRVGRRNISRGAFMRPRGPRADW